MSKLKSEQEPKLIYDLISEEYTERPILDDWTPPEEESDDDSTNIDLKSRKIRRWRKESDARYLKLSRNLSPYDAIPFPRYSNLGGGNPVLPLLITERNRLKLVIFSQLALDQYYQGASFEFHDIVKCAFWFDRRTCKYGPQHRRTRRPTEYYITFQAKAKGDPSNNLDILTFQAKVSIDKEDKHKPPVFEECCIKK